MRSRIVPLAVLSLVSLLCLPAFANEKLIALTFDDGPRPYVLFGANGSPGLISVLDEQHVNATFFVMGWRLTPHTWGDRRYEVNIGVTCIDAVRALVKRGDEIEDHTYSHVQLRAAEHKKGEAWVIGDVDHGAQLIQAVAGVRPKYVRPPDWILPDDARQDLERRGYTILSIKGRGALSLLDVNSMDYLCAGAHPTHCPKPSLLASVLRQIEQRERRGVYTHILAFHELSSTTAILPDFIKELKGHGYRFVTVREYMRLVGDSSTRVAQHGTPRVQDVSVPVSQ
jgi:peptidoglycan/xylan/chitin deacetylase (PgdA/CDA1 family)